MAAAHPYRTNAALQFTAGTRWKEPMAIASGSYAEEFRARAVCDIDCRAQPSGLFGSEESRRIFLAPGKLALLANSVGFGMLESIHWDESMARRDSFWGYVLLAHGAREMNLPPGLLFSHHID